MFTVEKMNGVYLVMKNGNELVNAHARKRDAKAEAAYLAANTYVERTNLMTGEKFMESVDTPYYCSPSSETYWSM
jgi:nitrate reductase cytochrome c-type subunit